MVWWLVVCCLGVVWCGGLSWCGVDGGVGAKRSFLISVTVGVFHVSNVCELIPFIPHFLLQNIFHNVFDNIFTDLWVFSLWGVKSLRSAFRGSIMIRTIFIEKVFSWTPPLLKAQHNDFIIHKILYIFSKRHFFLNSKFSRGGNWSRKSHTLILRRSHHCSFFSFLDCVLLFFFSPLCVLLFFFSPVCF